MNLDSTTQNEQIRKIEDIIDIQKANGNFTVRQVAFNLPEKDNVSANLARSLESGLSSTRSRRLEKKIKKSRLKRHKSPTPDVISWPSDSDITVLRMKLCLSSDLKERTGNEIPGDGLHQPDDSSMVNLATLIRQSQPPSKHSIIEEYLLPLTSWEQGPDQEVDSKPPLVEEKLTIVPVAQLSTKLEGHRCSKLNNSFSLDHCCELSSEASTKSKIAKFLRLYFCPCCRCLYKMENMSEDPSTYWEKRGEPKF